MGSHVGLVLERAEFLLEVVEIGILVGKIQKGIVELDRAEVEFVLLCSMFMHELERYFLVSVEGKRILRRLINKIISRKI